MLPRRIVLTALLATLGAFAAEPAAHPAAGTTPAGSSASPAPAAGEIVRLDTISVVGHGETRATSAITQADVALVSGGAEPVLLLKRLPGLIVHTNDTLGLYEWGLTVRMRGFDLTQIAFDLDGVPMGRNDVRGNRVSRFLDNENLLTVSVSQGSGDVATPAYSALGGAVHYATTSPATAPGVRLTQTFGSHDLARTFLRADTGTLAGGLAAYASVSHTRTEHAWGPGDIQRDHAELKLQRTAGNAVVTFNYRFNDRFDYDTFSLSLDEYHTLGRNHEVLVDGFTGDPDADTLNYLLWTNGRRDHLLHGRVDLAPGADAKLTFVPYFQNQAGTGTGWEARGGGPDVDPLVPGPRRLTVRHGLQKANRSGLTGRGEWTLGRHALAAGFWLEHENYSHVRHGYEVTPEPGVDFTRPIYLVHDWHFRADVAQAYVEDRISLVDDRLAVALGAKGLRVDRGFRGVPNAEAAVAQQRFERASVFKDWFQPQAGATFTLTPAHQLFVNYAQNFSIPTLEYHANLNYDPTLRPERSDNLDAGIRLTRGRLDASLSAYAIRYRDRILAVLDPEDRFAVPEPVLQNVGSVRTRGVEAVLAWRPADGWRAGAALAYTDSTFRNDYYDGDTLVPVRGRRTPDTPRWQTRASVDYASRRGFFAGGDVLYLSKRYGTPLNNQTLPAYAVCTARLGYTHPERVGVFRELRVQLTIDNLFDRTYLGQIDTPGVYESYYYPGAPRTWTAVLSLGF